MRTFTRLSLRPDDRLHHARRPFFNGENAQGLNCRAKSASSPMHLAWSPSDVASFPSHMARSGTWRLHSWVPWRERILHVNESGFCKFLHKQLADETSSCSTTSPLYGRSTKAHRHERKADAGTPNKSLSFLLVALSTVFRRARGFSRTCTSKTLSAGPVEYSGRPCCCMSVRQSSSGVDGRLGLIRQLIQRVAVRSRCSDEMLDSLPSGLSLSHYWSVDLKLDVCEYARVRKSCMYAGILRARVVEEGCRTRTIPVPRIRRTCVTSTCFPCCCGGIRKNFELAYGVSRQSSSYSFPFTS